jgi:lipid-A-disaccharide synthase
MKKVLLSAGEVSGDLHGAHLIEAIQRIDPQIRFFGMGGEGLKSKGMEILFEAHRLSVVGITEALSKIPTVFLALRELRHWMERERPDLLILIDFPEFNLRLAKMAHYLGVPVLYYISPQIWAWRRGRVKSIAKYVRKMIVFLPFEDSFYREEGVDVSWVGHPLLDIVKPTLIREEAFQKLGLDSKRRTIGLLPGSRKEEVRRHLPILLHTALLLQKEIPELQFVIPLAPAISEEEVRPFIETNPIEVRMVKGFVYDVMNLSELLLLASGTATLEAAILEKPMVILYKVSFLSYWIGRGLIRVRHIGLVNLLAGQEIVKELIQKEATPEKMAKEALRLLKDQTFYQRVVTSLRAVRKNLGEPGAAQRAAQIVLSLLKGNEL